MLSLLLAGLCSALALPPLDLLPILFLTIPFLLARASAAPSMRAALWRGCVFGFGLNCGGLYWITNAILTRVDQFWWAVPLAVPLCAIPLAAIVAIPVALCRAAPAGWPRIALFAGCWTLCDLMREFIFTGFPWNPLGSGWEWQGLAGEVMIQPAAWIGVPGLTLLTLFAAACPAMGRRGIMMLAVLLTGWAAAGTARLAWTARPGASGPAIVLVQGNIPEREKTDHAFAVQSFRTYLRLTSDAVARARMAMPGRKLLFAWPESAFPGLLDEDPEARRVIMQQASGASAGLIGSVRFDAADRPRNSLVALSPDGSVAGIYDKVHLVPFGEYQPAILPIQIVPGGGFAAGAGRHTLHLPGLAGIGVQICYEIIFPGQVAERADRPAWLLNITNDAWFGDSAGPRQHLAAVRMRAVEEGLPVARAANTGISAAYDGMGRELGALGWGREGTLTLLLPGPLPATLFAKFGLLVPFLLALVACLGAMIALLPRETFVEVNSTEETSQT